jgi:hypothetical protein
MGRQLALVGAAGAILVLVGAACSETEPAATATSTSPEATTVEVESVSPPSGPPLVEGFPGIEVLGPPESGAGEVPLFRWQPVDGAATYNLVVMGPELPIWAWQGEATEVRLGAPPAERPVGMGGPVVVVGTCWSVIAHDADGRITAASELLAVSPDDSAAHTCQPGSG